MEGHTSRQGGEKLGAVWLFLVEWLQMAPAHKTKQSERELHTDTQHSDPVWSSIGDWRDPESGKEPTAVQGQFGS